MHHERGPERSAADEKVAHATVMMETGAYLDYRARPSLGARDSLARAALLDDDGAGHALVGVKEAVIRVRPGFGKH